MNDLIFDMQTCSYYFHNLRALKMKTTYFAHSTAIIDEGAKIGDGVKIWHFCHVMKGSVVGPNCNIGQNVVIFPKVLLGKNVKIQNNVSIYDGIVCEDDVFLGPSMVFTSNEENDRGTRQLKKTIIKKGASIGANVTIVCGNNIGEYALIGAGAVVSKEVRPYSLVVGNPARNVGWISERGIKLDFSKNNVAVCPESQQEYLLQKNFVKRIK